jgi:hypothetical protein
MLIVLAIALAVIVMIAVFSGPDTHASDPQRRPAPQQTTTQEPLPPSGPPVDSPTD